MAKSDFNRMVKWLNDPLVLEFYEETLLSMEKVIEKFGPRVEGLDYVTPCIVEFNHEPIGYIQYYLQKEKDVKKYGLTSDQPIYGIDQFIGETHLWGKGIGTSMISMMLEYLTKNENVTKVVLDVKSHNIRAIKCYKKCGFKKIAELDGGFDLMEWSK